MNGEISAPGGRKQAALPSVDCGRPGIPPKRSWRYFAPLRALTNLQVIDFGAGEWTRTTDLLITNQLARPRSSCNQSLAVSQTPENGVVLRPGWRRFAPAMALYLVIGLAGCASQPERFTIEWHEVSQAELNQVCSTGKVARTDDGLRGCQVDGFKVCKIYTLPKWVWEQRGDMDQYHKTLGHEVRHCRDGQLHPQ